MRKLHYAIVTALLAGSYFSGIDRVTFHKNESSWIGTSYYFEAFLGDPVNDLRPDLPSPIWMERHATITQPPLGRYIIGVGRRLGGYKVTDLNRPWIRAEGALPDSAAGHFPSPGLLLWSRRPMAALAVVSGLLLFGIVVRCSGLVAGYAFVALFAASPYLLETLRHAMGESSLLAFAVAAMVAADRAVRARRRSASAFLVWAAVAGLCCGLSGASKLNGLTATFGVAGVVVAAAIRGTAAPNVPLRARLGVAGVASALVVIASAVAFIATNPFLYSNPARQAGKMLEHRESEMRRQRLQMPLSRLDGVSDRVRAAGHHLIRASAGFRFRGAEVVNAGLGLIGLIAIGRGARRNWAARLPDSPLVVLVVGATVVVPALLTPLDWGRYYLFPIVFCDFSIAVGVAAIVDLASGLYRGQSQPNVPAVSSP